MVLHRFPLSHYSEKARAALDFKGLEYRIVEHRPGVEQLAIYRLSGQRKPEVAGAAVRSIAEHPDLAAFFDFRDRFYRDHLQ
ncbi:glutathione S-transferase N-terminal domain-containing protein [Sorangium sp. So ce1128]